MLRNYFKVAVRHLLRQPGYSALNIFGLTLGIVSSLLIFLYLYQELSFDTYHKDADRLYRISSRIQEPDDAFNWAVTQLPLAKTVKETFGEVDQYCRYVPSGRTRMRRNDITYFIEDLYLVDSTVFEMFSYDFVMGDKENALNEPNSLVLSQSEADRIFKGENPMGQLLETDNNSYKITGVFKDQPQNSHLIANALASFSSAPFYNSQSWGGFNIYTYIKLNPSGNPKAVAEKLNAEIMDKYVKVIFDQFDIKIKYELLNIQDIHLYSDFDGEPTALGNIDYIYIFGAVALFLVLIACINYMNLATARSMKRALEVGIRKVMGAQRGTLVRQFIAESIVISVVSLILSILILLIAVPVINNGLGTNLALSTLISKEVVLLTLLIMVVTGILSGSYPAFYLSAFQPVKAMKGGAGNKRSGNKWLRRGLVGLQFAISIFMLISTFVVYDQMQFVRSKDLGFNKDQVLYFSLSGQGAQKWEVLRNKLLQNPNIQSAATATTVPGNGYGKNVTTVENNEGVMDEYGINLFAVDFDYFNTLDIDLVQGRDFSLEYSTDTVSAVIVNEAMVKRFGWDEPIGKKFRFSNDTVTIHKVIGVAKDFHHRSLYNPIEPLLFRPRFNNNWAMVKIDGNVKEARNYIEDNWKDIFPNQPFEPEFLDQNFLESYENDQLRGSLFLGFSVMMIIIAALGLLGLASFTAEQRTKEISIRKVLGANVNGLITLLTKEFVWLVLIGAIPAFGFAYYFASDWLQNFEYHVSVNLLLFFLVTVIILIVTMLTTGFHAYRAASSNPSENLKYE